MLITLLAVLGVDLNVLVAFAAFVLGRKRWVTRQPGAFRGISRVDGGEIEGLRSNRGHGYGHWVRDILVWTKAPFLFRNELVPTDGLALQRPARADEVKRLGDHPIVIQLRVGRATAEVAANGDDRDPILGPYGEPRGDAPA